MSSDIDNFLTFTGKFVPGPTPNVNVVLELEAVRAVSVNVEHLVFLA